MIFAQLRHTISLFSIVYQLACELNINIRLMLHRLMASFPPATRGRDGAPTQITAIPAMIWKKKNIFVYLILGVAWIIFAIWQFQEHRHYVENIRRARVSRGQDLANSFSAFIRSMGRFGVVQKNFLQASLGELATFSDVRSIGLYDPAGTLLVMAGDNIHVSREALVDPNPRWQNDSLVVTNIVELGTQMGDRPSSDGLRRRMSASAPSAAGRAMERSFFPPPRPYPEGHQGRDIRDSSYQREERERRSREGDHPTSRTAEFRRPPWMNEDMYRNLLRLQGPHYIAIAMTASQITRLAARDSWMRATLAFVALIAAFGLSAAWFSLSRSFDLQVRLVRAQEVNTMLREMNLAAAGLAHETRNPLNLVRGMAQIISKESPSPEVKARASNIITEVDRVASRLNEFMDYSKPRQANITATRLRALVHDVIEVLRTDLEDKRVKVRIQGPDAQVQADPNLLRQVLFNLLLNALQAVNEGGEVTVVLTPNGAHEFALEVRDNGPGVAPDAREEIFTPYYTTRPEGTGLGLAIVRQFVMAHQWDIRYLTSKEGLSVFRISGMKLV